jgi:hypothetical protein
MVRIILATNIVFRVDIGIVMGIMIVVRIMIARIHAHRHADHVTICLANINDLVTTPNVAFGIANW